MSDNNLMLEDTPENNNLASFVDRYKSSISVFLIGLILIGFGTFMYKGGYIGSNDTVEIINAQNTEGVDNVGKTIIVEISGGVEKPGVYKLSEGSRIEDLLIASGGVSVDADRTWVEKYINRAAKLIDGQKIYIVKVGEQLTDGSANNSVGIKPDQGVLGSGAPGLVNINTATLAELDKLPGIGQVYGQSIIDHRPYSSIEELLTKDALKPGVYEKLKDKISVY